MKSSKSKGGIMSLALVLSLAQVSLLSIPAFALDNRVHVAGVPVITLNASIASKAAEIQRNVDNSLVASSDHGPSSVKITYVKGLPVLTLGGFYVATVDNTIAKSAGTTPSLLAQKWASSLKGALSNKTSTDAYIAQLTGKSIPASIPAPSSVPKLATKNPALSSVPKVAASKPAPIYKPSKAPRYDSGKASSASSSSGVDWQAMPSSNSGATAYDSSSDSSGYRYQGRVAYIPAGMTISAKLMTSLNSGLAKAGDTIVAKTTEDIVLSEGVIPANSMLTGQVTDSTSGSRMAKSGSLTIKFTNLKTPYGQNTPITAHLNGSIGKYTDHQNDVIRGESKSSKTKTTLMHTAIGAGGGTALGLTIGAIAGGGRGAKRGAFTGLALGAGLGLAESLLVRKGKEVNLRQGENISLQLDAPVTMAMN